MAAKRIFSGGLGAFFWRKTRKGPSGPGPDASIAETDPDELVLDRGGPRIHAAIRKGEVGAVQEAYESSINPGLSIAEKDDQGTTPLALAVLLGHVEIVKMLLDCGAKVDPDANNGESLLCLAVTTNHIRVLKLLVAHGAPVDATDNTGSTPLHLAVKKEVISLEMVRALAIAGANPEARDRGKSTALMWATARKNLDAVKELLARGAQPLAPRADGMCPLHAAATCKDLRIVKVIYDALYRQSHPSVLDYEIPDDADEDLRGTRALHFAAGESTPTVVRWLLAQGADPHVKNALGETMLHWAAANRRVDAALILDEGFKRGLDANALQMHGATPLHIAAWQGLRGNVQALLRHGADPRLSATKLHCDSWVDLQGTAEQYARHQGHNEVADLLATTVAKRDSHKLQEVVASVCHEKVVEDHAQTGRLI